MKFTKEMACYKLLGLYMEDFVRSYPVATGCNKDQVADKNGLAEICKTDWELYGKEMLRHTLLTVP